jgi:mannose-6-phosphate isomerase-like protein (cupin superfamily)
MGYTIKNLRDVEDMAAKSGMGELTEARFPREDLHLQRTGFSHQRLRANKRQAFGHRHKEAEEVYIVMNGSGQVKLDAETVDIGPLDAIHVEPGTARGFAAGADGLEFLAFGPRVSGDAEIIRDFWDA